MADHQGQTCQTTLQVCPAQLMLSELRDQSRAVELTATLLERSVGFPPVLVVDHLGIVLEITVISRCMIAGRWTWAFWIITWDYGLTDASCPVLAAETL